jgi:hypothetical protein
LRGRILPGIPAALFESRPMNRSQLLAELKKAAKPAQRAALMRYFKTGPGEYGEGDVFLGVKMTPIRRLSRTGSELPLSDLRIFVRSRVHEERMLGLLSLVRKFEQAGRRKDARLQKQIYDLYMAERKHINNWDLIDLSAPRIAGAWLLTRSRSILLKLVKSKSIWDRRLAIMACFCFVDHGEFAFALGIARTVLSDPHDLIHKASGWMLREIGNIDKKAELVFLEEHADAMPRTMLRYAIEKFPQTERRRFLARGKTKR